MNKTGTIVLAATLVLTSNFAFAQSAGNGTAETGGSSIGSLLINIYSPGSTTFGSPEIGPGNPGFGNLSDPSVRRNPGLDANGPCNGARSTSGNNTPPC